MITVTLINKKIKICRWEYLKTWVGIFQVGILWVEIFRGGSTPWGSLIGGNFPGGSFPDILNLQLIQIGMGFFDTGFPSLIPGFQ